MKTLSLTRSLSLAMITRAFPVFVPILAVVGVSGCAAPRFNYVPSEKRISSPDIGVVSVAQIGDEMIRKGVVVESDTLKVNAPVKVWGSYTITPGHFKKVGEDKSSEYYLPFRDDDSGDIIKNPIADSWAAIEASKDGKKVGIVTVFNGHFFADARDVTRSKKLFQSDHSFER